MEQWVYKYGEYTIKVVNGKTTDLVVNDQVLDSQKGVHMKLDLSGVLPTGETVKAMLKGSWEVECDLLVYNVLQKPVKILER